MAALFLAACSPSASQNFNKNQSHDGIISGQPVLKGSPLASSIVGIYDTAVGGICTGSLLENNTILTAAHCVGPRPEKMFIIFSPDMIALLKSGDAVQVRALVRQVAAATVNPGWEPQKNAEKNETWNDIALLKFRGSVPAGFKPASFLASATDLTADAKVTLAGYGVNEMKSVQVDPKATPASELEAGIAKGEILCNRERSECLSMKSSGSGLLRSTEVSIAQVLSHEVIVDQTHGQGACSGDSGGPAYVLKNGQYYLWGITSRGTAGCAKYGVYTNALTYKDWILAN